MGRTKMGRLDSFDMGTSRPRSVDTNTEFRNSPRAKSFDQNSLQSKSLGVRQNSNTALSDDKPASRATVASLRPPSNLANNNNSRKGSSVSTGRSGSFNSGNVNSKVNSGNNKSTGANKTAVTKKKEEAKTKS